MKIRSIQARTGIQDPAIELELELERHRGIRRLNGRIPWPRNG
ncbi:MAG: hypothetical protein AB7O66_17120 [Limisphaerales bacterium]